MKQGPIGPTFVIAILVLIVPAFAHQPFFEDEEFNGRMDQSILLSITIPQITGQENFAPAMALIGPGLPPGDLPGQVIRPQDSGVLILPPPANASSFFEPFSQTSYWTRQEQYVKLPVSGSYLVAVWDDKGQIGRYVFVIGDREVPGGDVAFPLKMRNYWTPVDQSIADDYQRNAQANQTGGQQEGGGPVAQPGLGVAVSLMSITLMAFFSWKNRKIDPLVYWPSISLDTMNGRNE